ncbi:MAG TPA: hypothetical protein VEQ60_00225, partial [Longimicrobium sp.]|nr:hypothetical protein [Longimicrobium sp.]
MPDPVEPPRIDGRKASDLRRQLLRTVPHYTPEWPAAAPDDPGMAVVDAFALLAEGVIQQLNRVPEKSFIEFLNLLGVQLAPARPAIVPVQFRLSTGLAAPVLVRARTRCAAPARPPRTEDLPFETAEDLWAVPAALQALVSVDPVADAIYTPPPGFLALREAARPLPEYATVSFTAAGSGTLQLDRVDGLEPGHLLRVALPGGAGARVDSMDCTVFGPGDASRAAHLHLEVSGKPDGRIVPVRGRMDADLPAGTRVQKVTEFALFDSLNLQEHVLYLGHAELLNVKSAATFLVSIDPLEAGAVLPGFPVAWEWAAKGEAGVEWRAFDERADTSAGFGRAGVVELAKPEGEIIEAMVAGRTSRWIRARVVGPIPAVPRPRVPRLERVRLRVSSPETAEIPPDQTFHNDTPLQLPDIYPFGPEPRQFDRFYIASQEVFSKPNASVTLRFKLARRALGAPAATYAADKLQVFARDPFGLLAQLTAGTGTPPNPTWVPHEAISRDVSLAPDARPAVAPPGSPSPMVFVRGDDGSLYVRFPISPDATRWQWRPLWTPGVKLVYDPAVVRLGQEELRVFAVGEDRRLHSVAVHAVYGYFMGWRTHGRPGEVGQSPGEDLASSPAVIADGQAFYVYVANRAGVLYEFAAAATSPWTKVDPESVVGVDERAAAPQGRAVLPSRLGVLAQGHRGQSGLARILALVSSGGELVELTRGPADPRWTARNFGRPQGAILASSPTGAYLRPGGDPAGAHLFVRDRTGVLWERTLGSWRNAGRPVGRELGADPAALLVQPEEG